MRYLSAIFLVILLAGCSTFKSAAPTVAVPASLTQPCSPLVPLSGLTGEDILRNITDNAALYHECADSKDALIKAVKAK